MSTTRSKTTSKTTVADFEASAAASRLAFESASALRQRRAADLAEAQSSLAAVHAAWDSGDDSFPAAAEVEAHAGIARATRLLAAATAAERRAEAELVSTDVSLAVEVAALVAEVLRVQPAVQPHELDWCPVDLPAALLVQKAAAETDRHSGALSGDVELIFTRNEVHRDADPAVIEAAAERHGIKLQALGYSEQDGDVFTDRMRLRIARLDPQVPVLEVSPDIATAFVPVLHAVADVCTRETGWTVEGTLPAGDTGRRQSLYVHAGSPQVVSDRTHRGGSGIAEPDTRHLLIEQTFTTSGQAAAAENSCQLVLDALAEQQGRVLDGLGRVRQVTVRDTSPVLDEGTGRKIALAIKVAFEVVSRVSADAQAEQTAKVVPVQGRGRRIDPLEDDGTASHPGTVAAK